MDYDWVLYLFLTNAILGLMALMIKIKSKILFDYWPEEDKFGLQYENEIIWREKKKKVIFNLIFGIPVFIGVLFILIAYKGHPNPLGK
jgi:hypothetical protein